MNFVEEMSEILIDCKRFGSIGVNGKQYTSEIFVFTNQILASFNS